ncbi:MAG: ABC transporter substrate-binding protein [Bradymonadia bacterium]
MRIVSLLPAATEMVCVLGLEHALVGVGHECNFPTSLFHPERPGGPPQRLTRTVIDPSLPQDEIHRQVGELMARGAPLYTVDEEVLGALRPDVVITQSQCEVCAVPYVQVAEAVRRSCPTSTVVVDTNPQSLGDVFDDIVRIGEACGRVDEARKVVASLQQRLDRVAEAVADRPPVPVLALEWLDPPMPAGHWIPDLIRRGGGVSLGSTPGPARATGWDEVLPLGAEAEVVMLLPCGLKPNRAASDWDTMDRPAETDAWPAVQSAQLWAVDGDAYFNRPGPRLVDSVEIVAALCHGGRSLGWERIEEGGCKRWSYRPARSHRDTAQEQRKSMLKTLKEEMWVLRRGIDAIVEQLVKEDYVFQDLESIRLLPGPWVEEMLEYAREQGLYVPLSVEAFCSVVGNVNLMGSHPDWPPMRSEYDDDGSLVYADPFVFEMTPEYLRHALENWRDAVEHDGFDLHGPFIYEFAPDLSHKANVSGGGGYGFSMHTPSVDPLVIFAEERHLFMDHIRQALRCGGFSGIDLKNLNISTEMRALLATYWYAS